MISEVWNAITVTIYLRMHFCFLKKKSVIWIGHIKLTYPKDVHSFRYFLSPVSFVTLRTLTKNTWSNLSQRLVIWLYTFGEGLTMVLVKTYIPKRCTFIQVRPLPSFFCYVLMHIRVRCMPWLEELPEWVYAFCVCKPVLCVFLFLTFSHWEGLPPIWAHAYKRIQLFAMIPYCSYCKNHRYCFCGVCRKKRYLFQWCRIHSLVHKPSGA